MEQELKLHPKVSKLRTYADMKALRAELGLSVGKMSNVIFCSANKVKSFDKADRQDNELKLSLREFENISYYLYKNGY